MNLLKTLAAVSSLTMLSRVLGFVRDAVIARAFGAGLATDAFFVAFKIPNLLRRLFAEGAFSQAFVPVLAEYKNQRGEAQTRDLIDKVAGTLLVALMIATAIGVIAAPLIVFATAPGFASSPEKLALTTQLLRIVFPYILFISLTSFAASILNTWGRFSVPAFTPALLNVSFIVFGAYAAQWFDPPIFALAWAVFVGGVAQLAFQASFLARLRLFPRFRVTFRDEAVMRVLRLMGPAVFGVSIGQISLLINVWFASFLAVGSVSWLYYADRLMEFPAGLLGAALGTILLPSLSRLHAQQSNSDYSPLLDWGLRLCFLLAVPAAVALALLAIPLITTLFKYGVFTAHDAVMTRNALVAYCVGLPGLILVKVLAPGFYARQNMRTPVRIGIATLAATQLMNLAFVVPLKHAGLALAIGLGGCMNAALLYRSLRRAEIYTPAPGWGAFLGRLVCALVAMALTLRLVAGEETWWITAAGIDRVLRLAWIVPLGAMVYFAALWALGFRLRDFVRRVDA